MPGPRRDKERAWKALEEVTRLQEQIVRTLLAVPGCRANELLFANVRYDVAMLKQSGRLDKQQVVIVRKLVEDVIRVERQLAGRVPEE